MSDPKINNPFPLASFIIMALLLFVMWVLGGVFEGIRDANQEGKCVSKTYINQPYYLGCFLGKNRFNKEVNMNNRKMIDLKEFTEGGYLQEANRQFFHPLGLALSITKDEDGIHEFGGIWDCRDDPEGFVFSDLSKDSNKKKRDNIAAITEVKVTARFEKFGFHQQPIGHIPEKEG